MIPYLWHVSMLNHDLGIIFQGAVVRTTSPHFPNIPSPSDYMSSELWAVLHSVCDLAGSHSPPMGPSPRISPRKRSRSLMICFSLFQVVLFHLWPPIWAHMDPYRPVYNSISFLYDLYIVFTWCLDDVRWFYE